MRNTLRALIISGLFLIVALLWIGIDSNDSKLLASNPKYAVILLHGYGANPEDMMNLAGDLKNALPVELQSQISFFAPEGIHEVGNNKFSWYENPSNADFRIIANYLESYIGDNIDDKKYEKIILAGFSQGASVAVNTSSKIKEPVVGAIGFAGEFYSINEVYSRQIPMLLIHGAKDNVVSSSVSTNFSKELSRKNIFSKTVTIPAMGHQINLRALMEAAEFIGNSLN